MNRRGSTALRAAALLGGCALLAVSVLVLVHDAAAPRIAAAELARERALLATVLPPSLHDNAPLQDAIEVRAVAWLGNGWQPVRRARRAGQPTALVLTAVAEGYAGPIVLLVAVATDGRVLGVRVLRHQETPGLGDWIEAGRSDWIDRFAGRSLADPVPNAWTVRREGGAFDQFAGATITPRAVVRSIAGVLDYVRQHREALFAAAPGTRLVHDPGGSDEAQDD